MVTNHEENYFVDGALVLNFVLINYIIFIALSPTTVHKATVLSVRLALSYSNHESMFIYHADGCTNGPLSWHISDSHRVCEVVWSLSHSLASKRYPRELADPALVSHRSLQPNGPKYGCVHCRCTSPRAHNERYVAVCRTSRQAVSLHLNHCIPSHLCPLS